MNILTDCNIIWLDDKDIDGEDLAVNIQYYVISSLYTFTDLSVCLSFIRYCTSKARLLLLVVRDRYLDRIFQATLQFLPSESTVFIYVLYDNKFLFRWKTDTRIREIFHVSEEQNIVNKLQEDLQKHLTQRWSSGYCVFNDDAPQTAFDTLNNENAKFMWFQLLVQVLLRMPPTAKSKDELLQQSFLVYSKNPSIQEKIHEFNRTYQAKDAINWYTKPGFLYRLFNQACRIDDIDLLFNFRFFIRDLHEQLTKLYHEQQSKRHPKQTLIVYRGTLISKDELNMLLVPSTEKKVIWFNTFVSTSYDREVAKTYVSVPENAEQISVLEEIHIDDNMDMSAAPFADIHEDSNITGELEILMSIGSVFELESIKENHEHIWEMKLHMVKYDDRIRNQLRDWLEEDIEQETTLLTLSNFLAWRGDFEKSEKYNKIFLEEFPVNNLDQPQIYNNLGYTYQKMGRFADALCQLNTSIHLYLQTNVCDYITNFNHKLACAYNNKGLVLSALGDFTAALECINKSLDLRHDDDTLPEKQRNRLAVERSYCHENLGLLYNDICEYELALHHLQEALNIRNEKLPSNHYMIAQVYNNLSRVYRLVSNPSKAFECTEQALVRQIQSLPADHPHLGTMYNTLGEAFYDQGQYSMALFNYEKALHIYQAARTRNPLLEAIALSNMGTAMKAQENFDGALTTFLHALSIIERKKPRHPDVARCLNNIGFAYLGKRDNPRAIIYFNQALSFCQSYLTENNEVTAISYLSMASVLTEDQYDLAMEYFQRVITIYNHLSLPHHRNVIVCHTKRGYLYRKRDDHHSALACYEQALFHCCNASLPQQHPLWVIVYTSFAFEYDLMGEYHRALEEYEHALQHITKESLETPRIYSSMELCRRKIVEVDVLQTMTFLLDDVMKLLE